MFYSIEMFEISGLITIHILDLFPDTSTKQVAGKAL